MGNQLSWQTPLQRQSIQPPAFPSRRPFRQIDPGQSQSRRSAGADRLRSGHHQIERLVVDRVVAEPEIEIRIRPGQWRAGDWPNAGNLPRKAHCLGEQGAPVFDGIYALQWHGWGWWRPERLA